MNAIVDEKGTLLIALPLAEDIYPQRLAVESGYLCFVVIRQDCQLDPSAPVFGALNPVCVLLGALPQDDLCPHVWRRENDCSHGLAQCRRFVRCASFQSIGYRVEEARIVGIDDMPCHFALAWLLCGMCRIGH